MEDLDSSIVNMQSAVNLTEDTNPDKPSYLSNLGISLSRRFLRLGHLTDLENAIINLQKAVRLISDENLHKSAHLCNLAISLRHRYQRLEDAADLHESISNFQKAVALTDDNHSDKIQYIAMLGISLKLRFDSLGDLGDLDSSIAHLNRAVQLIDDSQVEKNGYYRALGDCQMSLSQRRGNPSDLEEAIMNFRRAVQNTDDGDPEKPQCLFYLSGGLRERYVRLAQKSDLEEAISIIQRASQLTDDNHPTKARYLINLGELKRIRLFLSKDRLDYVASLSGYQAAAKSQTAYPGIALKAARRWASLSYQLGDLSSALEAYRTALEILPKIAWLGLDLSSRQIRLTQEKSEDLSCLAASCAIQLGRLEEAVELLDLGRSIFWQQASSLRSDLELLRNKEPGIAQELEGVGRRLEAGNFSDDLTVSLAMKDSVGVDQRSKADIGRDRRLLVEVWEGLLEKVRGIPEFEYFLKPIPFLRLRQAASTGRVIVINASRHGVDALIFDAIHAIRHVPLPDTDLEALNELSANVQLRRPVNPTPDVRRRYINGYLKPALRAVWNDIVSPIFKQINISLEGCAAEPQQRVWWYPTGPLTFLPIHAAGPAKSPIDVSTLVISSYATTLGSLFQAQEKKGQRRLGHQRLLAISQTDTPGQTQLPQSAKEVQKLIEVVRSAGWSAEDIVRLDSTDATVDLVSAALDTCSWAHFACHGVQDPSFGMKSAFALHDGALELGQIAAKRLSTGQFAFLSVCHAASGMRDLPGEAMHLAGKVSARVLLQFLDLFLHRRSPICRISECNCDDVGDQRLGCPTGGQLYLRVFVA